jgi:hypothetical protein
VPDSVAAKAPAAKAAKGGDKRAAQTPKKVPKKAPLGLTASLGSGGKHAAPSTRAAAAAPAKPAAKPAPAPAPAPEEEEEDWDAPPRAGFLGGAAMDVDDDIVDDDVAAPLDEEDEEDDDAPPPQQQRKGAAAAKAMPPPPPRAPAAAAAGGRKSVAAPKTAPQEELAAAAAASKRKAAEEEAAAAAAEREAQAQAAAAKKAADAEKAAAAKKAAAAAKKVAAAEKAAAEKAAAAAAKAAAAEAARQKKAAADKAAAEKAKPKARKAASASEDSSGDLAEESEEEEEVEEAAVKPKPRGKSGAAQHPPADVTPEDRVAELGVRRVTEALAEQAAAAAAEEAEQEAAAAAKQARRVAKPPRSPPAPAAANPRRTSAELVQRLLAGVDDDAPVRAQRSAITCLHASSDHAFCVCSQVAQSSELTACEPVEPRALFRTTSARPQKRKAGSPSGAGAADDATGGGTGRAAKRTRPLPGDTDDATLSALQRIVAEAKAAAAARAKEEISALLAAAWQDLDAALSALAARHADEREAMAAEFAASRAATLRRLNASRDEYQAAVKRFKADVAPMLSGRGGATDTLAALDAAMEERHAETRQKHAAEYKSVRFGFALLFGPHAVLMRARVLLCAGDEEDEQQAEAAGGECGAAADVEQHQRARQERHRAAAQPHVALPPHQRRPLRGRCRRPLTSGAASACSTRHDRSLLRFEVKGARRRWPRARAMLVHAWRVRNQRISRTRVCVSLRAGRYASAAQTRCAPSRVSMEAPEDGNNPHECPAEQAAGDGRYSSDDGDSRPAHRPSTAPQPDQDAAATWGREGHLTEAQKAHLASMRRKLPHADDAEARSFRGLTARLERRADAPHGCPARPSQLLRWLRARAFNVERALALQQDSTAWRKSQRPTFNAPAAQVVEQLLKRGAPNWRAGWSLRSRARISRPGRFACDRHATGQLGAILIPPRR